MNRDQHMSTGSITTSARFRQAAWAESARLATRVQKLEARRSDLQASLGELQDEISQLTERIAQLRSLAAEQQPRGPETGMGVTGVLRGANIRETAVKLLAAHPEGSRPIHYRRWLAVVEAAGYSISGKRPEAVFLGQVLRSPLVRASTQPGIYSLDLNAPSALQKHLNELDGELHRALDASSEVREERRDELVRAINRARRQLAEASRCLPTQGEADLREAA